MIPYITKGDLTKLTPKRQRKICGCNPLCQEFYTYQTDEDDFILCAGDTKQFALEIFNQLGLIDQNLAFPKTDYGWTDEQELLIQRYLKDKNAYYRGKVKYGTYSNLAQMLGKTREQVKNKIQHMRKEGKL
ncbi:hypothetical protein LRS37_04540 [Neobacillus sedimentimangrovi]|uniref:DNA-binding protein n=1 Tax=Neobacillus sedimentimangrovi TaxID=2699460 RepID=A0ABS8QFX7_9BACI|nr:hypothetical protein [Neobacillus sedimentimangrovi]MCD4838149.1 hypothetical protein [Neobacillus sedimentimangrovi]